jgi:hypothetical protein
MTHRRFELETPFVSFDKGKLSIYSKPKAFSPREERLSILRKASSEFGVPIHWQGGIAWDYNAKYLKKRGLVVERKFQRSNQCGTHPITLRVLHITQKGKEYLAKYAK